MSTAIINTNNSNFTINSTNTTMINNINIYDTIVVNDTINDLK